MMTQLSDMVHEWMGWCPNAPVMRSAPAVLVVPPETRYPAQPDGGGTAGRSGRIRHGISIAAGSLRTLLQDWRLLWFTTMAGLVMLCLIGLQAWIVSHIESAVPFLIGIPFGDSFLVIDTRLFLIEMICLSCFTILLAGLVLYRNRNRANQTNTIREAFAGVSAHAGPLAALSVVIAIAGTLLYEIVSQSQFFGKIIFSIDMAVFYLPYAYYFTDPIYSALYFALKIMVITIFLFLLALYVVPIIVLEKKGLVAALAGSVALIKKTWRELLGCFFVYGAIILGVASVALVIGQSPLLLNHDYDFFLQVSRGQVLMMTVCYLFIIACWILMAIGSTATGIAITDLYSCGMETPVQSKPETHDTPAAEPAS
jgi:hypothetical protein